MKRFLLVLLGVCTVAIASLFAATVYRTSNAASEVHIPKSLVGEWHQSNNENPNAYMVATVTESSIQISMKTRDSSSLYWLGTFDGENDTSSVFQSISKADQDALRLSVFGSGDETKVFTYESGVISFDFTMMGTTTNVRLIK